MKKQTINICLTSDNNYAEHMYVTVFSLLYNLNKKIFCYIYILDSGLVDKVHNLFYGLEKKFNNCKIVFVDIDESKYHKYPDFGGTYQTYFRIDIPYLLPNIDKILYLDPDIVVDGDIMGLYNIDLLNYAIGTPMIHKDSYYYNDILKIPNTFGYFNGGVLLMNLKYFRENNITEKIFNYLLLTKKIILMIKMH